MKLFSELKRAAEILSAYPGQWAICGGVAASIYRSKPRFTDDIYFAVIDSDTIQAEDLASQVISKLGYREYWEFIPDPMEPTKQLKGLLCARLHESERFVGLDFLLPTQSWVHSAVQFATHNLIDYGFAKLPTVTPESLIVAKAIALSSIEERLQDEDDIRELLKDKSIDLSYVRAELVRLNVSISAKVHSLIYV